jgi:hypothetical protein
MYHVHEPLHHTERKKPELIITSPRAQQFNYYIYHINGGLEGT